VPDVRSDLTTTVVPLVTYAPLAMKKIQF
jgi:hypothetical protein